MPGSDEFRVAARGYGLQLRPHRDRAWHAACTLVGARLRPPPLKGACPMKKVTIRQSSGLRRHPRACRQFGGRLGAGAGRRGRTGGRGPWRANRPGGRPGCGQEGINLQALGPEGPGGRARGRPGRGESMNARRDGRCAGQERSRLVSFVLATSMLSMVGPLSPTCRMSSSVISRIQTTRYRCSRRW